ncbi:retrovirus-related pol polyprotein from transposon TNT 1-94 [Tanacetum coccineum]
MVVSGEMFLEWIIDSGGSYNMTPKRGFLFDFKEFNNGTVLLSDNRACAIKGPGKERVHMKDDSSFVIENVRYILEFKKNLISLGILNREGYTVNLQNGRVNVIKGGKLKKLRKDNGLMFCNQEFNKLCKESGITRNLKVVGTPQQSSLAGQINRTLLNKVGCLLIQSGLLDSFSAEAMMTATYLISRSPSLSLGKNTPMYLWSGHPANYEMLRIFGCVVHSRKKVEFEVKLLGNRVEPIVNPHTWENPGYEDKRQNEEYARPQQRNLENYVLCVIELREQLLHLQGIGMEVIYHCLDQESLTKKDDMTSYAFSLAEVEDIHEPIIFHNMINSSEYDEWIRAIDEEMNSLKNNHTWELVGQPLGHKLCGIVYTKGLLQKEFDMKELCPTMKILGLVYGRDLGNHMDAGGFVDSYFSNNPDKGRSITGYVFIVLGCVVSWKATLQHVVALSTTEVMYMTLTKAVKESIWLKGLRVNLRSMVVNYDNQAAIHL